MGGHSQGSETKARFTVMRWLTGENMVFFHAFFSQGMKMNGLNHGDKTRPGEANDLVEFNVM